MQRPTWRGPKGPGGWWGWSDAKSALEWLFWTGRITTATRRASFERVLRPRRTRAAQRHPEPAYAQRARRPAPTPAPRRSRTLGIATAGDLRDYFRLSPDDAKPPNRRARRGRERLLPCASRTGGQPAYLDPQARRPRRVQARALLAPVRSADLGPDQDRAPVRRALIASKSTRRPISGCHGYYVLPFLLGDRLVARVDLKADRAAGRLLVQGAHAEPGAPGDVAPQLATELRTMAGWLGLGRVQVQPSGDLAGALRAAVDSSGGDVEV